MNLPAGTALGPYVIVGFIGAGGMGEVYRARDTRLGREVAIKVLNADPDPDRLGRFEREARATALLAHPNILTIFDVGVHEGCPFLVCELLDGRTLRDRLAAEPMRAQEAIEIGLQLARGVAAAHALHVVHRDLKPENIFLTRDGSLKILDFGLAKLKPESPGRPDADTVAASSPGLVIGTPGYMAPEQVRGGVVDERTDIFAVGTVLYEMLSGAHPFRRASPAETMAAILGESPPPMGASVPPALERTLFRCLEKLPENRFASASELAAVLDSLRADTPRPFQTIAREPGRVSSVAVLPFLDMSPAHDQDYLCDGIAEELINVLTQVEGLRVSARSSSFQFRASAVDVRAIGARLGVDTVLEGGVRKVGDRLRVTVRLVDVAEGYQRWSHRFDGRIQDVFDIQDEIARSVATALRGFLSPREKEALRRPETAVEAYEYFLRGRQLLHRLTRSLGLEARELFEKAIEIDPGYAPAYAGLAQVNAWFYEWWHGGEEAFDAADRASRKALGLAPGLSESHTARAFVLATSRRYDEAAREFEEAIRLNPSSYDAYYLYGRACFASGKIEQSVEMFRRGAEIQPEDYQCMVLMSQSLDMLGRAEEAGAVRKEGIRRLERRLELAPDDPRALSLGASTLAQDGQNERAIEWARRAIAVAPDDPAVLINAACMYAKAGRKEEALACLEKSFARGFGKRDWIERDPDYDSLRDDPRFQAMLEKLG
jgi:non-specific serine/threonine protein kinase